MTLRLPRRSLLLVLLASGCASPEPAYYALGAVPGRPASGAPRLVEIRDPSIAGYLDRSEIVRSSAGYKLDVRAGERWGEPFGPMLGRVLAEDLSQRLVGTTVFTAHSSLTPDPQVTIDVDIQRFDLGVSGHVTLRAQIAVSRGKGRTLTRTVLFETVPSSNVTPDLVAAMSRALGLLADTVAGMVRTV